MPLIERFLDALLENVVCLICLLPIVGAALTMLSAKMGAVHSRSTALTNAALTLSLALLMVANYGVSAGDETQRASDIQMISVLGWFGDVESSPDRNGRGDASILSRVEVRYAVGVDGVSLWPIVLTSLLTFVAIWSVSLSDSRSVAPLYALILVQQSLTLLLFAALDSVLFCIALQLSSVPMFFLIGGWGGYDRVRIAIHHLLLNSVGSLAVTIGLVSVAMLYANLSPPLDLTIPRLMNAFPAIVATRGADDWRLIGPAVLLAVVGGCAARLPSFPLHTGFVSAQKQVSLPVGLMLAGLFPLMGLYGLVRLAVPLLAVSTAEWATLLRTAAICGSVYCGMLARSPSGRVPRGVYISLCSIQLAAAGILTLTPTGITGGLLLAVGMSLSLAAFQLTDASSQQRAVCTLAVMSIPGSAGFAGLLLISMALVQVSVPQAIGGLIGWVIATTTPVRDIQSFVVGGKQQRSTGALPLSHRVRPVTIEGHPMHAAIIIVLLALIAWIGVRPQFFVRRIERSVARILSVTATGSVAEQPANKGDESNNEQHRRVELDEPRIQGADKPDNSNDHHHQAGNQPTPGILSRSSARR